MRASVLQQIMGWLILVGVILGLIPGRAQALSLSLSSLEVGEAIRYGQSAQHLPFADFAREWRTEGAQGPGQQLAGSAWLQSPFAQAAHTGWAAAHRGLSFTLRDLARQLESFRDQLAFAVTLLPPPGHPWAYHVSLHQDGRSFPPSHVESHQDVSERGPPWVYLYCLFPAEGVDLEGTVILVVNDAYGDSLPFVFDLSRMR